jgi:excisionase family DNA binding protein
VSDQPQLFRIGEAAHMLGLSVSGLRHWTDDGKIAATRTLGGERRYSLAEIERVRRLMDGVKAVSKKGKQQSCSSSA